MKFTKIALILTLFFSVVASSQRLDTIQETTLQALKYDGKLILGGVKHAFTRPFHWDKNDWLKAGGFAAGTAIMYIYDEEVNKYFIEQNEKAPQMLKEIGWYYGSPQNFFMIASGIYGYGLVAKNEEFRHTGVLIISSAVATGLIQTIAKNGFGRARPSQLVGNDKFKPFSKESGYHSFPSGHAILSFTASHAIAKQFENYWVKGGIYAVGLIAPVSRLWINAHWLTDVVLGMAISIVVVDGIDNFLTESKLKKGVKKISWQVNAGVGTIGLVGTF